MSKILLTGSAGAIGRVIAPALLAAGHEVRGFDLQPNADLDDQVIADLTDAEAVDRAMAGRDALIHLAAYPDPAPFVDTLLGPNVIGLYQVVDAAKRQELSRVVLASSMQVISGDMRRDRGDAPIGVEASSPTNDYALTKVWAEQLGAMLARTTDITVLVARIAWYVRNPKEAERVHSRSVWQRHYISARDIARFFVAAVESDATRWPEPFQIAYAIGPGRSLDGETRSAVDLEPGRRLLGYEPRDAFPKHLAFDWQLPGTPEPAPAAPP